MDKVFNIFKPKGIRKHFFQRTVSISAREIPVGHQGNLLEQLLLKMDLSRSKGKQKSFKEYQ